MAVLFYTSKGKLNEKESQTGMSFGGQGLADTNSFNWWRYYGESQDVNLKIDEAGYVIEIIVSRYAK
jgi:hypothetical protein